MRHIAVYNSFSGKFSVADSSISSACAALVEVEGAGDNVQRWCQLFTGWSTLEKVPWLPASGLHLFLSQTSVCKNNTEQESCW